MTFYNRIYRNLKILKRHFLYLLLLGIIKKLMLERTVKNMRILNQADDSHQFRCLINAYYTDTSKTY